MKDCSGCKAARALLHKNKTTYKEIPLDNPLVQLGSQVLFKNKVMAPILATDDGKIYILNGDQTDFIKVKYKTEE